MQMHLIFPKNCINTYGMHPVLLIYLVLLMLHFLKKNFLTLSHITTDPGKFFLSCIGKKNVHCMKGEAANVLEM